MSLDNDYEYNGSHESDRNHAFGRCSFSLRWSIRGFTFDGTFLNFDSLKLFASICCFLLLASSRAFGDASTRAGDFLVLLSFSIIFITAARSACSSASSWAYVLQITFFMGVEGRLGTP